MWLQPQSSPAREMLVFALCALVVAPLQTHSLARIGLYEGLVQATSLRASFLVAWKVGLLPWLVWMTFMLSLEAIRRCLPSPFRISDEFAFAAWASVHLLVCGVFLAHANRQLNRNFRALAAQSARPVWWKRWLRLRPQLAG
jgi:hypothetical protein